MPREEINLWCVCDKTKMGSLIENYEKQYAVLTAEITSEIGKLKRTPAAGGLFY